MVNIFKYSFLNFSEYVELFIYSFVGFIIPFLIGHPQVLVGIIVNVVLFMSAKNLTGIKLLPVIIAPSLGVLARGIIFGPLTVYLAYLIPFIWFGNSVLVFSFRKIKFRNTLAKIISSSVLKSGFLFFSALILFKLGLIPFAFLTAMGIIQLITALTGGIIAFGANRIRTFVLH